MLKVTLEGNSCNKSYCIYFYCTNIIYRAISCSKNFGLPHRNPALQELGHRLIGTLNMARVTPGRHGVLLTPSLVRSDSEGVYVTEKSTRRTERILVLWLLVLLCMSREGSKNIYLKISTFSEYYLSCKCFSSPFCTNLI